MSNTSYNIPKQARNKYNVVKTNNYDINNIVTTTNLSMSNGGSGGGGGGGGITPISHQQAISVVNQQLAEKGLPKDGTLISYQNANAYYTTYNYVTSSLSNYYNKEEINGFGYITNSTLTTTLSDYTTKQDLDEKLENYSSNEVTVEENETKTVSQDDGIIVLTYDRGANTVTLPVTGIEDGKTIYIINKSGHSFSITTNGNIIDKASDSSSRQTQSITDNVVQLIYYNGEWFVI